MCARTRNNVRIARIDVRAHAQERAHRAHWCPRDDRLGCTPQGLVLRQPGVDTPGLIELGKCPPHLVVSAHASFAGTLPRSTLVCRVRGGTGTSLVLLLPRAGVDVSLNFACLADMVTSAAGASRPRSVLDGIDFSRARWGGHHFETCSRHFGAERGDLPLLGDATEFYRWLSRMVSSVRRLLICDENFGCPALFHTCPVQANTRWR